MKAEDEERRKTQETRIKQSNKKDLESLYELKMKAKNNKELNEQIKKIQEMDITDAAKN